MTCGQLRRVLDVDRSHVLVSLVQPYVNLDRMRTGAALNEVKRCRRPSSGILAAYRSGELGSALGLFMITWFVFTMLLLLATFRSSIGLVALCEWIPISLVGATKAG